MELPSRELSHLDFHSTKSTWIRFPKHGSQRLAPGTVADFEWKDYCPLVFRIGSEIPEDANEHSAGKSDTCTGCPNQEVCATAPKGPDPDLVGIAERMATVKHKILILSGKGGVGKSTFSAQLSFALAGMDYQVGLLDIDICWPSIPKMLGLEGQDIHHSNLGWSPVYVEDNLGVMSIGFMLPNPDDAVIW